MGTCTSKTDVVVRAIAQCLDCTEELLLSQGMTDLENKVAKLELEIRSQTVDV